MCLSIWTMRIKRRAGKTRRQRKRHAGPTITDAPHDRSNSETSECRALSGRSTSSRGTSRRVAGRFQLAAPLREGQRNLVRGVLMTPKNHQRRRIDLSHQLTAALRLWRRQQRAWLAVGRPFPEWVFSSVTGTALDESNVRKALNRILDGAGVHVVDRIRRVTRLRRCCCRRARRSRTSASN
jgi:hypothetical protein